MEALRGKKFCFAGNRFFVLEELLNAGLDVVKIFAVPGSFLERELAARGLPYESIENKKWLVQQLEHTDFDYFVSNGLPIILPITRLTGNTQKQFINIHPSCLPDLRGIDPVPGSLLHGRSSGATCHYMNDEIDGGDIIAQVEIPYTDDMDCGLLYQLSFRAEKDAFKLALQSGFAGRQQQALCGTELYYNLKEEHKLIDFSSDVATIIRQIKAFNTRSQGAYFMYDGSKVIVRDAELVTNPYVVQIAQEKKENEVLFVYEGKLLIKKGDACLKLKQIENFPASLKAGTLLST
ncbi:MAG: formyltransferase family protein [Bacteroidota bacterium]